MCARGKGLTAGAGSCLRDWCDKEKIWRERRKTTYSSLACLGGRSGIGNGGGISDDDLLVLNGSGDGGFGGRHYSVRGMKGR
jgi:hypothetical protein